MGDVVSNKRLPFDPNSRGARQLVRMMSGAPEFEEQVDVLLTEAYQRIVGERGVLRSEIDLAGEQLKLPRSEADRLIARGTAELV
jgi:hypothetical protein